MGNCSGSPLGVWGAKIDSAAKLGAVTLAASTEELWRVRIAGFAPSARTQGQVVVLQRHILPLTNLRKTSTFFGPEAYQ